jgi:hypothetical protein
MHITAGAPVVVYGINRTTATSDGMLVLPVSALGLEYVVASAADISDGVIQKLPSQYMVIAPYDTTSVTMVNPWDSPGHKAGESYTVTMHRGDVFSVMSMGTDGDLSGAWIRADKPVAVTAGVNCTYLPNKNFPSCDHLSEMMTPITSWGKSYLSVPYANRTKGDLYRIFAGEDNTKIYINGTQYGMLPRKGGGLGVGFLEFLPPTRDLLEITADKPIMVAQYNNSQTYDNSSQADPFVSLLSPVEQYQTTASFCTPLADFSSNFLNLVCDSATFSSVEIRTGGSTAWKSVASLYGSDVKKFPGQVNGRTYVGKTLEMAPGTYSMRAAGRFTATLYGVGTYDSYGYPFALAVANIAVGDIDRPTFVSLRTQCNQSATGTITDMPDEASQRANLSAVELDHDMSNNYSLVVSPFKVGMDRSTDYQLNVIDLSKEATAVVIAVDMAGNEMRDTIRYQPQAIAADKSSVNFDNIADNTPKNTQVRISNLGADPVRIDSIILKRGDRHFTLSGPLTDIVMDVGASINVDVVFQPVLPEQGEYIDTLGFVNGCGTRWVTLLHAQVGEAGVRQSPGISQLALAPNPAAARITLSFTTAHRAEIQVVLYNIEGRRVRTIVPRGTVEGGEHTVQFDVRGLTPGLYPLHVIVGDETIMVPPVVVK